MSVPDSEKDLEIHIQVENKMLERLKASEIRYRNLLESMPSIVVVYDGDGVISYANQAWKQLFCDEAKDVVGQRLVDFCHADDRKLIDPIGPIKNPIEVRLGRVSSGYYWLKLQADKGLDGQYQGFLVDVSETRKLEEILRKALKMEAIGRISGWMAHEFNNLLTVILGGSDRILRDQVQDLAGTKREAERIQKAANQAASLTRKLMAVSSQQVMRYAVVDLVERVQDFFNSSEENEVGKNIKIHKRGFDLKNLLVKVDSFQLAEVMRNLIHNARDAMEHEGNLNIEIDGRTLTSGKGRSHELPPGEYALLAVEDDGCGIAESNIDQIFEPFFTTKDQIRGKGFGLAIVHGIMKQSHGAITVQSTVGVGTRFEMLFPLVASKATVEKKSHRILLVDDEPMILELTAGALEDMNYQVDTSNSGAEAIEMIKNAEHEYDLVVTDVIMPEEGGKKLLAYLSALEGDSKVLAVSGYDRSILPEIAPAANFLQKPFRIQEYIQVVSDLLAID